MLTGLTPQEAAQRLAADGPNELPTAKKRNLAQQAEDVVREPMLRPEEGPSVLDCRIPAEMRSMRNRVPSRENMTSYDYDVEETLLRAEEEAQRRAGQEAEQLRDVHSGA